MNGLLWSFNRLQLGLVLLAFGMGASLTWAQTPDTVKQSSAVPFKPLVFTVLDGASTKPVAGARVSSGYFVKPGSGIEAKPEEFVTDENGKATFQLPEGVMFNLSISVVHSNYAPQQMLMQTDTEPIQSVPPQSTMNLTKGVGIGGFVRDEKGQGVAGLKVLAWGYARNTVRQPEGGPLSFRSQP